MNRYTEANPDYAEYLYMVFQLGGAEIPAWQKLGIHAPPKDAEPFITFVGNELRIGIRPRDRGARAVQDNLDGLTADELAQKCAMASIKVRKEATRADLLAALRVKGKA